jgi:sec-independent protein translocase protein TatA
LLPNIGIPELIIILVVALIVFGPGKLPEVGKSLGKTIREFRKSSSQEMTGEVQDAVEIKKELKSENTDTGESKAGQKVAGEEPVAEKMSETTKS